MAVFIDLWPCPHRISKILFALGADEFLAMLEGKIGEAPFFKGSIWQNKSVNSLFYFLAFEKLDPNLVNALLADEDLLKSVLLYHVLPSEVNSDLFQVYDTLDTLLQGDLLRATDNCSGAAGSIAQVL